MYRVALSLLMLASGIALHMPSDPSAGTELQVTGEAQPVFYAIVMGKLAHQNEIRAWVASLRTVGKWSGTIVLVTNAPDCVAKTLNAKNLLGEKQATSDEKVHIYGTPGEGQTHILKVRSTSSITQMKLQKAKAWSNVQNAKISHPVSSIIYVDEDIVIGLPLNDFLEDVRKLERSEDPGYRLPAYKGGKKTAYQASRKGDYTKVPTIALFMDQGASRGELHTGIVVIFDTEASRKCMSTWGHQLRAQPTAGLPHRLQGGEIGAGLQGAEIEYEEEATEHHPDEEMVNETLVEDDLSEQDFDDSEDHDSEEVRSHVAKLLVSSEQSTVTGPDQMALGRSGICRSSGGIRLLNKKYFVFPTTKRMRAGEKMEFNHFTNTGRMNGLNGGHKMIKDFFVSAIGLPEDLDSFGHAAC